ncbi:MAG: asparaginyl-tRNA synthetase [Claussenomyces sp. TS43310]|nr:MAG: asparaginyl-tRNA synthetase [Claussenomyces sp. TS43310]
MAQQCLRRTGRIITGHARRWYHSSGSESGSTLSSVATLLESPPPEGKNVTVAGFVRSIRNQKTRSFLSIGDGTSLEPLQALLSPNQAQSLSTGAAVCLTGSWQASPTAKNQSHELHVDGVSILGPADPATFPLQKKYHTPEYLRTIPHLRTRTPFNSLMLRLRSKSIAHLTHFFAEREFVQTHPPIITSSDCEGAGEVFTVASGEEASQVVPQSEDQTGQSDVAGFFRSPKYLTVSSQLHLEALAQSVGKVWTLSPTFRAEKSDTSRHLSEFYMLEAEVSYVNSMDRIMDLVEDMLRSLTKALHDSRTGEEILYGRRSGPSSNGHEGDLSDILQRRWHGMMSGAWPRITYTEAIDLLNQSSQSFEHQPRWGHGLQSEHERFIAESVGQGQPVFVMRYPQEIKPFYMLPSSTPSSPGPTVDCFDLLVPETCEIVGGSMREHRLPELMQAMRRSGLISPSAVAAPGTPLAEEDLGSLKWYVDLRRWGSVPHGGFGLGFDRLLSYLAGVQNIRDVVAFPRWVGRCDC